ncbi:MAG TPA: aminoglycoside phosphotransferase family protein [Thermomicrobiales bacterium]|nr:aminoglycoside phosphotransferase family protein [Thermomicrobiales bacterium]
MPAPLIDPKALAKETRNVLGLDHEPELRFLARGEYSLNYLTTSTPEPLVIRCVTGSQIGLSLVEQVRYEARALRLLAPSGRTPRWIATQPEPEGLPFPFLVETWLPGSPLDYATGLEEAARCVAAIHRLPVAREHGLLLYGEPGPAIVAEAREWAASYLGWNEGPRALRAALQRAFAAVEADLERASSVFAEPDLAYVNYDLNTHNFIVRPDDGFVSLIDWEKARVAPATQDLAHFLLPTTTLWRTATATRLTPDQETRFIDAYLAARPHLEGERLLIQLASMKRLIALRAVAWCSWAVVTSATGNRAISNEETIERSRAYLDPEFLHALFAPASP